MPVTKDKAHLKRRINASRKKRRERVSPDAEVPWMEAWRKHYVNIM